MASRPLEGVRVVEMGMFVAGPAAAAVLADWGAEVIKLENPAGGDPIRALMAMGVVPFEPKINPSLELDNRGKRSITIDVQNPAGRELARKVIAASDVFVSNLRPAALRRAGLGWEELRALNPRLVYAGISGYGTRGPDADRAAFDYAAWWARSGAMACLTQPGGAPPTQRPAMGDHQAALGLAGAIAAALFRRERTGEGEEIHLSLYQMGLWMMATDIETCLVTGMSYVPTGRLVPNPLWNHYRAADDRWFHLVMIQADRYWGAFCQAIGRTDLEQDDRFQSILPRAQNAGELIRILDDVFASRPLAEWAAIFDRHDLIWAPVATIREVVDDPQAQALESFQELEHRSGESIRVVRSPVEFGGRPVEIRRGAPELGEHTEEVLLEMGFGWDDIAALREKGALG